MNKISQELLSGLTTQKALKIFDDLPVVDIEFMLGRWSGAEIPTDHQMDGLLDAIGWHGKHFISPNDVHPLVIATRKGTTYSMLPYPLLMKLSLNFPIFRKPWMRPVNGMVTRLIQTKDSQARARMVAYRGKVSATMIYDRLPIHDHFRKLDSKTVMGLMDFKWTDEPYFFMLERE